MSCFLDNHTYQEPIGILVVMLNFVFVAMRDPTCDQKCQDGSQFYSILDSVEWFFSVYFTLELSAKMIAMGVIMHKGAFLRGFWGWLDVFVVLLGWLSILPSIQNLTVIRTLRVVRTMKIFNHIPSMQVLFTTMQRAFMLFIQVILQTAFLLVVFAIIGVQLFDGSLRTRLFDVLTGELDPSDDGQYPNRMCNLQSGIGQPYPAGYYCDLYRNPISPHNQNPTWGYTNFDNIFWAFLTIFQCLTLSQWTQYMYWCMDALGWSLSIFYFVSLTFTGAFLVVNLLLAVLSNKYEEIQEDIKKIKHGKKPRGGGGGGAPQLGMIVTRVIEMPQVYRLWLRLLTKLQTALKDAKLPDWFERHYSTVSGWAKRVSSSTLWYLWVVTLVLSAFLITCLYPYDRSQYSARRSLMDAANVIVTLFFCVEALLEFVALGPVQYLSDTARSHRYNLLLTFLSVLQLVIAPQYHGPLYTFRLLRVFDILRTGPSLNMREVMQRTWKAVGRSVGFLPSLIIIIAIFALFGMQLFGGLEYEMAVGEETPRATFNSVYSSALTVFQLMTGDNWNDLMFLSMRGSATNGDLWAYVSPFYFVIAYVVLNFFILNIFLAILLYALSEKGYDDDDDKQSIRNKEVPSAKGVVGVEEKKRRRYERRQQRRAEAVGPPHPAWMQVQQFLKRTFGPHLAALRNNSLWKGMRKKVTSKHDMVYTHHGHLDRTMSNLIDDNIMSAGPVSRADTEKDPGDASYLTSIPEGTLTTTAIESSLNTPTTKILFPSTKVVPTGFATDAVAQGKAVSSAAVCGAMALMVAPQKSRTEMGNSSPPEQSPPTHTRSASTPPAGAPPRSSSMANVRVRPVLWNGNADAAGTPPMPVPEDKPPPQRRLSAIRANSMVSGVSTPIGVGGEGAAMGPPRNVWTSRSVNESFHAANHLDLTRPIIKPLDLPSIQQPAFISNSHPPSRKNSATSEMLSQSQYNGGMDSFRSAVSDSGFDVSFSSARTVRDYIRCLVSHWLFDRAVLILIAASCVVLSFDNYKVSASRQRLLRIADVILMTSFTVEMTMKIVALGFLRTHRSYLRSGWNALDGSVVMLSWIGFIYESAGSAAYFKAFRALRALRPLRLVTQFAGMKIVLNSLTKAMAPIMRMVFITVFVFIIFAVLGMQLFSGKYNYCSDSGVQWKVDCVGMFTDDSGTLQTRQWLRYSQNFDTMWSALLTLFEIASLEGWTAYMWRGVDAVAADSGPVANNNMAAALYFVSFVLVGTFFVYQMFISIVVNSFREMKEQEESGEGSGWLTEQQKEWKRTLSLSLRVGLRPKMEPPKKGFRRRLYLVVTHQWFDTAVVVCISLNTLSMVMYVYDMKAAYLTLIELCNAFFTTVFCLEAAIKIIALGYHVYFGDRWNIFDFLVAALSGVAALSKYFLPPNMSNQIRVLRAFRVVRLFRLVNKFESLRLLMHTFLVSLAPLMNVGAVLFVVFFVYAVLGVTMFGRVKRNGGLTDLANFDDVGIALLTLFRMCTGENWNQIMWACTNQVDCTANVDCGTPYAPWYFVSFMLVGQIVMLNLFIAVVVESFKETMMQVGLYVTRTHVDRWVRTWERMDPDATEMLDITDFPAFLKLVGPPLGLGGDAKPALVLKYIQELDMKVFDGKVHFYEALKAAVDHVYSQGKQEYLPNKLRHAIERAAIRHFTVLRRMRKRKLDNAGKIYAVLRVQLQWRHYAQWKKQLRPPASGTGLPAPDDKATPAAPVGNLTRGNAELAVEEAVQVKTVPADTAVASVVEGVVDASAVQMVVKGRSGVESWVPEAVEGDGDSSSGKQNGGDTDRDRVVDNTVSDFRQEHHALTEYESATARQVSEQQVAPTTPAKLEDAPLPPVLWGHAGANGWSMGSMRSMPTTSGALNGSMRMHDNVTIVYDALHPHVPVQSFPKAPHPAPSADHMPSSQTSTNVHSHTTMLL